MCGQRSRVEHTLGRTPMFEFERANPVRITRRVDVDIRILRTIAPVSSAMNVPSSRDGARGAGTLVAVEVEVDPSIAGAETVRPRL